MTIFNKIKHIAKSAFCFLQGGHALIAYRILLRIADKTDNKVDDKLIKHMGALLDFLKRTHTPLDEVNENYAEAITKTQGNYKDYSVGYDSSKKEYKIKAFGADFKYNPNDGSASILKSLKF